jgi:hypothetical protein
MSDYGLSHAMASRDADLLAGPAYMPAEDELGDLTTPKRACSYCGIDAPGEVAEGEDYCSQDCAWQDGEGHGQDTARWAVRQQMATTVAPALAAVRKELASLDQLELDRATLRAEVAHRLMTGAPLSVVEAGAMADQIRQLSDRTIAAEGALLGHTVSLVDAVTALLAAVAPGQTANCPPTT